MRWLAVALLVPGCAGCCWIASTLLTVATGSCCSGVSLWDSFAPGTQLLVGGLILWHAAAAVAAGLGAVGFATRLIRM